MSDPFVFVFGIGIGAVVGIAIEEVRLRSKISFLNSQNRRLYDHVLELRKSLGEHLMVISNMVWLASKMSRHFAGRTESDIYDDSYKRMNRQELHDTLLELESMGFVTSRKYEGRIYWHSAKVVRKRKP